MFKPTRYVRQFSMLMVLLLSLGFASPAFAADSPIVNGSFNDNGNSKKEKCSLKGWSHKGDVKVVDGLAEGLAIGLNSPDNCVAMLHAQNNGVSLIEQTFVAPQQNSIIKFYLWAKLGEPQTLKGYYSQTVSLYDSNNKLIVSSSRNENIWQTGLFQFFYDLSKYSGQKVRLEIKVEVDKKNPASPTSSTLYVDAVSFGNPDSGTIQGTYAW